MDYQSHIPSNVPNGNQVPQFLLNQPNPNYNPIKFPPHVDLCIQHGKASRIAHRETPNTIIQPCPCCGKNVDNTPISCCGKDEDLYHLGYSYPLYFFFKRSAIVGLILYFLIFGLFSMNTNHVANNDPITLNLTNSTGLNSFDTYGSFLIPNNTNLNTMIFLGLGATIVFLLYYQYFRAHQKRIIVECDRENATPSDYTVMLSGLDDMAYDANTITDFMNMQKAYGLDIDVKNVSLT